MEYTLITANGRVMQFYIRGVAEMYKDIHGGVILTGKILNTGATEAVVVPPKGAAVERLISVDKV